MKSIEVVREILTKFSSLHVINANLNSQKEAWFSQNNLRLIRIRESEFKKKMYDQILRTIHGECHGL
jgi:hypothetical protein